MIGDVAFQRHLGNETSGLEISPPFEFKQVSFRADYRALVEKFRKIRCH